MRMRSGFSLFEMVLVLGILALTAALVWPALETMYGDSQLQNASDTIRSRLIAARSDAMEDGKIYLFRFTPGGANWSRTASQKAHPGELRNRRTDQLRP